MPRITLFHGIGRPAFGKRWTTDVDAPCLPGGMIPDSKIDAAIFGYLATANSNWRKVAMVIVQASDGIQGDHPAGPAEHDIIAKRIAFLVDGGRLLAKGDITNWRYSEVKVP